MSDSRFFNRDHVDLPWPVCTATGPRQELGVLRENYEKESRKASREFTMRATLCLSALQTIPAQGSF